MTENPKIEKLSKHLRYTALKCLEDEKLKINKDDNTKDISAKKQ